MAATRTSEEPSVCVASGVECSSADSCRFCEALVQLVPGTRDAGCASFVQTCRHLCQFGDVCSAVCGACSGTPGTPPCMSSQPENTKLLRSLYSRASCTADMREIQVIFPATGGASASPPLPPPPLVSAPTRLELV
eukprot:5507777-Prymnesium_polylepis.1